MTVLIPLLNYYTLRTTKYLNYLDFKAILAILSASPFISITANDLAAVKPLLHSTAGINSTRTLFDNSLIRVPVAMNIY